MHRGRLPLQATASQGARTEYRTEEAGHQRRSTRKATIGLILWAAPVKRPPTPMTRRRAPAKWLSCRGKWPPDTVKSSRDAAG